MLPFHFLPSFFFSSFILSFLLSHCPCPPPFPPIFLFSIFPSIAAYTLPPLFFLPPRHPLLSLPPSLPLSSLLFSFWPSLHPSITFFSTFHPYHSTINGNSLRCIFFPQYPPKHTHNGVLLGYYVAWKYAGVTSGQFTTRKVTPATETKFQITNLILNSPYEVKVQMFNAAGAGPYSDPVVIKTKEGSKYTVGQVFTYVIMTYFLKETFLARFIDLKQTVGKKKIQAFYPFDLILKVPVVARPEITQAEVRCLKRCRRAGCCPFRHATVTVRNAPQAGN